MDDAVQIDLARAAAFRIGALTVEPSLRQVTNAAGTSETLEPRVMQVLVALSRAGGRIVSRDELITCCWDGRIVGDDAINRVIVRLRRLAEEHDAFRIATVPRVGYRLVGEITAVEASAAQVGVAERPSRPTAGPPTPAPAGRHGIDRRFVVTGGLIGAAVAGAAAWGPLRSTPGKAAPGSIAVLPFANLSGDASQSYLSDGIAEELRGALARIVRLRVAARTSSELMRGAPAPVAAARLGVADIVIGSVRRGVNTIRVSAQLIDGRTGLMRWSQTYDRAAGDTLTIETDLAENVATALQLALGGAERALLTAGGTRSEAAYEAYARGSALAAKHKLPAAIAALDAAITADPNYALARSARAGAMASLANASADPARPTLDAAEAEARRAIALAPQLGRGYAVLGFIRLTRLDLRGATTALATAYRLAPSDTSVLTKYALLLAQTGQSDAAVVLARRAQALDPLRPDGLSRTAAVLLRAGRYDEAIRTARESLKRLPGDSEATADLAAALLATGRAREALAAVAALPPDDWQRLSIEAVADARLGDHAASDRATATLARQGDDVGYQLAGVHAQRGEVAEAFAALDRAVAISDPGLTDLRNDPMLSPLRRDPRFLAIKRRLGFS